MKTLWLIIKIPFGLLLYLLHPGFRKLVRSKMAQTKGLNDRIEAGEEVIAILNKNGGIKKEVIR